jgi:hypothetical protein
MRSSRGEALTALLVAGGTLWGSSAGAQQQAQGFDLERLYTSAPGGGWFVMDTLDMHGGLGGAISAVTSYARDPLRISDGQTHLTVVSDEAFFQLGFAATYDRFRLYATFDSPLTVRGNSGTLEGYTFTAPSVDLGNTPDAVTHGRLGFDARLLGDSACAFRLGVGAQLLVPGGAPGALQTNYLSDGPPSESFGAYGAMFRVLVAGDMGAFAYAGQLGVNVRSLDESPTPESPRGNEALFGAAGGFKFPVCDVCRKQLVVGPEIYGATAFESFFTKEATALESLLTARLESTVDDGTQLRFKLGGGPGLNAHFGAPEWRAVLAVELVGRTSR